MIPEDTNPLKTFDLLKSLAREAMSRDPKATRTERINLLLRKLHQVGSIVVPIPNLIAFEQIRKLPTEDRLFWLCEALFILHNQHNEDKLFLRGDLREFEKAKLLSKYQASDVPNLMVAVLDMLEALEKKSLNYSKDMQAKMQDLISQLNSSHSPKEPASASNTSSKT